jgi:drug/metabolite transporter (DMT)-like permease
VVAPSQDAAVVAAENDRRRIITAILVMLLAGLCSSLLHIGVRYVSPHIPAPEIVFIRSTITIFFTLPIVLRSADLAWRTSRPGLQIFRGFVGVCSMTMWYYALGQLPLADAGALSFTTGLFVTLGAALLFKEQVGVRRWSAVAIGFIGALIVFRPGAGMFTWPAVAAVVSSALWAGSLLLAKELAKSDSTLTISFYQPLLIAPFAAVVAIPMWVWPEPYVWAILAGMGGVAAIGNYCYIYALRLADASIVMPADYVRLVWMAGWGFLFFSEIPLLTTWVGALLIVGATLFITVRESRLAAERRRAAGHS